MASDARVSHRRRAAKPAEPKVVGETIASVVKMEERERAPRSPGEWLAEAVTGFSGSLAFVAINAAWFAGWISWNSGVFGLPAFDPFPYSFLTFAVSLEAIFLATFVLISQNRQSARADRRSVTDLQVNVIAERELTKILKIVADIHDHVGASDKHDPEVEEMLGDVRVEDLERHTRRAEDAHRVDGNEP
jgi:uncharacterized membrane protein